MLLNADCSGSMLVIFVEHEPKDSDPKTYRGIGCDDEGVYLETVEGEIRRLASVEAQDFELAIQFDPSKTWLKEMHYPTMVTKEAYPLPFLEGIEYGMGPSL